MGEPDSGVEVSIGGSEGSRAVDGMGDWLIS